MSNENKTPGFKIEIPECLEEPVKNLAAPVSKEIGQTLGDVWFLIFGKVGLYVGKKRAEYEKALNDFKDSLEQRIDSIPEEKLTLPDTQVVAGALEDSRFCVEKKELREMFENLIAASVNSDTADSVHPSFSNIIRHMSPHDASVLKLFKEKDNRPIVNFVCRYKTGGFCHYYQNIFRAVDNFSDMEQDSLSLECLKSLGLISFSYDSYLSNDALYEPLKNSKFLLETQDLFSCNPGIFPTLERCDFQKGVVALTDFGTRFLKICT